MGLYIEVQYRGDWWGEDPLTETVHETPGALFRALAGKDKARPWEALGRCAGKVYIDNPIPATLREPGAPDAIQVGWVFVARNPSPTSRADEALTGTGLREAWVTVHEEPPTVTRTPHYATFR